MFLSVTCKLDCFCCNRLSQFLAILKGFFLKRIFRSGFPSFVVCNSRVSLQNGNFQNDLLNYDKPLTENKKPYRAVVVAQLVERSLPIPEVRGSNPVIGKNYIGHLLSTGLKRQK